MSLASDQRPNTVIPYMIDTESGLRTGRVAVATEGRQGPEGSGRSAGLGEY